MKQSITVSLDGDVLEKLKMKQAGLLENSKRSVSLSKVVNQVLSEALSKEELGIIPHLKIYDADFSAS